MDGVIKPRFELTPNLLNAARLSGLPGITIAIACKRFGVKKTALQRARKQLGSMWLQPSPEILFLAMLTDYAVVTEGNVPTDLAGMASYIDYVNKDGCNADGIRALMESLAARGVISVKKNRWKLLEPWPNESPPPTTE